MVVTAAREGGWLGRMLGVQLLLATMLHMVSAFGEEFSSKACRELGFSSNFTFLDSSTELQLYHDCRGCYQEEAQFETKKLYAGSLLEVYR
jgi:hypothetical protein